ncbi:AzlD family protein [Citrobacter portucalensis]|uniref:AzlD family protein n=1 Tax=Citrobacter portucalensis TaxID=1639133 RepID=UPI0021AEB2C9|nr:AzlD family protein [Citrobacter portucalensis]
MMLNYQTVIAIVLMALTTYATRVTAYLILRNRVLTPRAMVVLKSSPGCVMLAFIAPIFASGAPADLIALGITLFIAMRFSMPITVISGVLAAFILRHYFG